ncbi:GNAT family N-acetyltransferase [Pseudomonas sp. S37]|uniref:GNAT family N-acetyltransferase n=1 Tax=Pseudomonas sp. S37 TaxID=2767449 RepID=UPI0019143413|nr:GNAT family N-acetyltransferase [Pseudomonas sp. S37]MBK4997662.1 GNAT family N-acetyltransferase [Pseudomonas sp. S37]
MTLEAEVRLARQADLEALFELDAIAQREDCRRQSIARAVASGQCWVAADADDAAELLGYGVLDNSFFGQDFIPLVVVRDSARRRGIGAAILRVLQSRSLGDKLFTSTNASNLPMQALLGKLGFVGSGQVENLDDGDPELVFVKFRS